MTEQNMEQQQTLDGQPIIPPVVLLAISGLAVLVALVVFLLEGAFGVLGWAALAVALLALVLLVVLAPQQVVDALSGRTFRFGGTSLLVTLIFLAVLITVYWFVASQNWTYDVSQTDQYSLNEANREAVQQLGADTTIPPIEIIGFYDANSISNQERTEILLEDYEAASDGKVSYRFVNPDRAPLEAQQYGAANGSLVVINTTNEDPEAAEVVNTNFGFDQVNLSNAILSVSAGGSFRAYFLAVEEGLSIEGTGPEGASDLVGILTDRFNWDVQQVSFVDLAAEESEFELNASGIDGDVLAILGGSQELSDLETEFIINYLDEGGSLVMFASPDLEDPALASSAGLNTYLAENYGLSFDSNVILDPQQSINSADTIVTNTFTRSNFITENAPQGAALIAPFSRSITLAEAPPAGVQVFDLVRSSPSSYAKTIDELLEQNIEQEDDDPTGPLTIVAAADNADTGGRVVLFGSSTIPVNQLALVQEAANLQLSFNSLVWATGFDDFIQDIPQVQDLELNPADVPVTAEIQQLNLINLISLFVLPFGVLIIGGVVWFTRRSS